MKKQLSPFSDKISYHLNSGAVGDLTAAAGVLKYAIDNFHTPRNQDYRVALFPDFKILFPFVPEDKFISLDDSLKLEGFAVRKLNIDGGTGNVARLTPSRFHLVQYASIGLLSRVLDLKDAPYVPLKKVPVDHFGIDFDKAVVMVVTFRDKHRSWPAEEIIKTAKAIHDLGLIPVFIGKTGAMANWKNVLAKTEFEYPGFGVNLLDKTTIPEMATIMAKSRAVMGMDSGPLHIAMTTNTPVICGFTSVNPDLRIPYRGQSITIPIIPDDLICRFCQSDWNLDFWSFTKCPREIESPPCVEQTTADKFIAALHTVRAP